MPFEIRVATDLARRLHDCQANLALHSQPIAAPGRPGMNPGTGPRAALPPLHSVLDVLIIDDDRDTRFLLD